MSTTHSGPVTLAAAQYPVERVASVAAWEDKLDRWVGEAARSDAALALFPEYAAMELTATEPRALESLGYALDWMADRRGMIDAVHARLAREHGLYICAASTPSRCADGRIANVARLFSPAGGVAEQAKQVMTRFEREAWGVAPGHGLMVADCGFATVGIAICYDAEFPLIARAMAQAGATLILVPSCTDTMHGYWRVRVGAQARALENQCMVLQAPTVGDAPWCEALDSNHGAAGLFGPCDTGFPADGVVALGEVDAGEWLYAPFDASAVARVRAQGAVFNHRHWDEQPGAGPLPPVERVALV